MGLDYSALFDARAIAYQIVDAMPARVQVVAKYGPYYSINPEHMEQLAFDLTLVVAEVISTLIDAGSERDVVLEELYPKMLEEVKGWGPDDIDEYEAVTEKYNSQRAFERIVSQPPYDQDKEV